MNSLSVAGNLIPPLYDLIIEKGYEIRYSGEFILAKNENIELKAYDLIELGALVFLYENKGLNWKVNDEKIEDCLSFIEQNQ